VPGRCSRRPPGAPAPDPASLALVRRVLGGPLAAPLPATWDDVTAALKGTGRDPLTEADRSAPSPRGSRSSPDRPPRSLINVMP